MQKAPSVKRSKKYRQLNCGIPAKVFSLLCPVREADWIDGWEYSMIYSHSGLAEPGCVFTTPSSDNKTTTWYISEYDPQQFIIEFVRMTPAEMVVKISIRLSDNGNGTTTADILYEYTSLSEEANRWIIEELDTTFSGNMAYWEKAINHYLQTGTKLLKA